MAKAPARPDVKEPIRRRRQRRSREDVLALIREAALQLFAERGYAGATTQEIARKADVSETLLFRHFGGKAALYDAVVSAPFLRIMETFGEEQQQASAEGREPPNARKQSGELFDFFEQNREVFSALMLGSTASDGQEPVRLAGLEATFRQAATEVGAAYARAGKAPPFDLDIAVRLTFGMVASAVLLRPLLFSSSEATSEEIRAVITAMSSQALWPV
jgi:AcrR family transcriptional regulator